MNHLDRGIEMHRMSMPAGLGLAGAAALLATTSCTAPPDADSPGPNPAELLAVFDAAHEPQDRLPQVGDGGGLLDDSGVVPETARRLGSSDGGEFWAAQTEQDEVCLVAVLAGETAAGSSCGAPEQFTDRGTWVTVQAQGESAEAYLVPDGLAVEEVPDGLTAITPWLVAGSGHGDAEMLTFTPTDDADPALGPVDMPLR